jgi:hypothetical protein
MGLPLPALFAGNSYFRFIIEDFACEQQQSWTFVHRGVVLRKMTLPVSQRIMT